MSIEKKNAFLAKTPHNNVEFAAQRILSCFTQAQLMELQACFGVLDEALYKSWSKDMTFLELKEAVVIATSLSDIQ